VIRVDPLGVFPIKSLGILPNQAQKGGQAHIPHPQRVQNPVIRHGVPHRHESAPVVPAIADAQHGGGGLLPAPRSHLHRHGAGDPPEEHLLRQREQVGPPAGDAPQPLVPVHTGGDAGVHPGAHHVQPQLPVAVHQVKGRLRTGG